MHTVNNNEVKKLINTIIQDEYLLGSNSNNFSRHWDKMKKRIEKLMRRRQRKASNIEKDRIKELNSIIHNLDSSTIERDNAKEQLIPAGMSKR